MNITAEDLTTAGVICGLLTFAWNIIAFLGDGWPRLHLAPTDDDEVRTTIDGTLKPPRCLVERSRYLTVSLVLIGVAVSSSALAEDFMKIGTTVLCESKESVGFNWDQGHYHRATFKPGKKYVLTKVDRSQCPFGQFGKDMDAETKDFVAHHTQICIKAHEFGEEERPAGDVCFESITGKPGTQLTHVVSCNDELMTPNIRFAPNGFYHLAFIHEDVSKHPDKDYKDSQYVEWGVCSVISGN